MKSQVPKESNGDVESRTKVDCALHHQVHFLRRWVGQTGVHLEIEKNRYILKNGGFFIFDSCIVYNTYMFVQLKIFKNTFEFMFLENFCFLSEIVLVYINLEILICKNLLKTFNLRETHFFRTPSPTIHKRLKYIKNYLKDISLTG